MNFPAPVPVPGLELIGEILVRECGLSPDHLRRGLELQREEGNGDEHHAASSCWKREREGVGLAVFGCLRGRCEGL